MNDFDSLVKKLNKAMMEEYGAVNMDKNPVYVHRKGLSYEQLAYALGQYSFFPKNIASFLYSARGSARKAEWKKVDAELTRNLGEELGTETNRVTHYDLLLRGIKESLGEDFYGVTAKRATSQYISTVESAMQSNETAYVLGGTYAMESSAIPEIKILVQISEDLAQIKSGSRKLSGTLKDFFDMHLETWEVGHEDNLRKASKGYISSKYRRNNFENGFRKILETMDAWWNGLHHEAKNYKS